MAVSIVRVHIGWAESLMVCEKPAGESAADNDVLERTMCGRQVVVLAGVKGRIYAFMWLRGSQ